MKDWCCMLSLRKTVFRDSSSLFFCHCRCMHIVFVSIVWSISLTLIWSLFFLCFFGITNSSVEAISCYTLYAVTLTDFLQLPPVPLLTWRPDFWPLCRVSNHNPCTSGPVTPAFQCQFVLFSFSVFALCRLQWNKLIVRSESYDCMRVQQVGDNWLPWSQCKEYVNCSCGSECLLFMHHRCLHCVCIVDVHTVLLLSMLYSFLFLSSVYSTFSSKFAPTSSAWKL